MVLAPGHLIGQLIGNFLEAAIEPRLSLLAEKHELYLDKHGPRPGVRVGNKLSWEDDEGNKHDLDFVLERAGKVTRQGVPAAFVESAWRRYTKHSKNKAQEIQGAVLPIIRKWREVAPVAAAVVAGEWSSPALEQLRNSGFTVLHLAFGTTAEVFAKYGVDIVGDGERTSDEFWQRQVNTLRTLSVEQQQALAGDLYHANRGGFDGFVLELERRIIRTVEQVVVTPLHGSPLRFEGIQEAVSCVEDYPTEKHAPHPFARFEIRIVYTNGDRIEATFDSPFNARQFLESFS